MSRKLHGYQSPLFAIGGFSFCRDFAAAALFGTGYTGVFRTGGRAAEGTGLLNRRSSIRATAGSNPALSAFSRAFGLAR